MQPKSITINAKAFSKAIDTVIRCVNTDESPKVATQGVYIVATPPSDRTPGSVRFTAMDSYRLATHSIEYDGADSFEAIAHAKNLKPLITSLKKTGSESLKIFRWQGMLEFWADGNLGGYLGDTAIIEGDFPGYQHLIPGQFKRTDKTLLVISPVQIQVEGMTYLEHAGVKDAVFGIKGIKSYGEGGMRISDLLSPILKDALVEAGMYQEEGMLCSVVFVQTSPSYRMEIFWDEEKQLAAIAVAEEALYWTKASSTKDAIERYLQVDGKAIAPQSS